MISPSPRRRAAPHDRDHGIRCDGATPRRRGCASLPACLVAVLCTTIGQSRAAGGHFAVDDAALLDPGRCQVDAWVERDPGAGTLVHLGGTCRAGAVEIALNGDQLRVSGEPFATLVGPQVKWADAIDERTSIGVVAQAGWSSRSARYVTSGVYVPLTVRIVDGVWLHANGGRDWFADAPSAWRAGVALEWQAASAWFVTGEALRVARVNIGRVGVRWQPSASFSVDLSRARSGGAIDASLWTLGASWSFSPWPR